MSLHGFRVPMSLGCQTTKAKLLYQIKPASMDIKTEKNGLHIKNSPVRLEIDNRAFFDSLGIHSIDTQAKENCEKGKAAALEATAQFVREGHLLMGPDRVTVSDLAREKALASDHSTLVFVPLEKPRLLWQKGTLDVNYVPDEVHLSWDTGGVKFQYQPYSIQFWVDKWKNL